MARSKTTTAPVARSSATRSQERGLTISRPEMLVNGSDLQFQQLIHALSAFQGRQETLRQGHAAMIGLVGIEYAVLAGIGHLARDGDVTVRIIAEYLHIGAAFIAKVVQGLKVRGLVNKAITPDVGWRLRLTLTREGGALLRRLAPTQRQVNDVQFDCLTAREFHQLLDMIKRLVESSERATALQRYLAEKAMITFSRRRKRADPMSARKVV